MSGISSIFASDRPDPIAGLPGNTAKGGTPPANDAFSDLLTQSLNQNSAGKGSASAVQAPALSSAGLDAMGEALATGNISAAQQAYESSKDDQSLGILPAISAQGSNGSDSQWASLLSPSI